MAYVANVYQGNHIAAQDLQAIEDNFEYLRTHFSAASAPADPGGGLEGVVWWDSDVETLKIRDSGAWRGIFSGGASFKIWAYLDSVPDGWTRDATITDQVLALKGGATYTTGAQQNRGSWTISGLTDSGHTHFHSHSHNHKWYDFIIGSSDKDGAGSTISISTNRLDRYIVAEQDGSNNRLGADSYTDADATTDNTGSNAVIVSSGAWRINAAVGIMLFPKM